MEKSIFVSREELYQQVWTTPTRSLATNYGISDVALAKICKKLSVPKPPKGYWAKVAAGSKPKRACLPKPRVDQQVGVTISPSPDIYGKFIADADTGEILENIKERDITVPETLHRPHPLIRTARKHLRLAKPNMYGMLWTTEACLAIRISKASLNRGLILLNMIFRELEIIGFRISVSPRGAIAIEKDGSEMTVALYERSARSENPPPKKKEFWWSHYEKYSFEPSGELEIILGRWPIGESRWKDTTVRSLENRIKDILIGIVKSAELVKLEEIRRDEEEERRRRVAETLEEQRLAEAEERQRRNDLEDQAANWDKAQRIRRFVAAAEAVLHEQSVMLTWADWARKHANQLDPLTNGDMLQILKQ